MAYFFLALALALNTVANTLMKVGADNLGAFKEYGLWAGLLKNYPILIGLFLFALNVVFYVLALSKINLSIAYPFMTVGGVILITLISYLFFKESISPTQMAGISLMILGLVLVAAKF
jgi:multidrug transporter EmrE-like cation transporter